MLVMHPLLPRQELQQLQGMVPATRGLQQVLAPAATQQQQQQQQQVVWGIWAVI
jgi:hypothetical protein